MSFLYTASILCIWVMTRFWTRKEYHEKIWGKMYWLDDCPFCTHIEAQEEHILWKWKHWFVVHNIYPYTWDHKHIMAVPYLHKKQFLELNDEELIDLKNANIFIKSFYWEESYFSCLRETLENRSVEHLHYHFLPWKLEWKYLRKMLMDQGYPIIQDL